MQRKHKKFSFPRKMYDKTRILDENKLKARYGLKNKREIWRAEAKVKYFRNRAKNLFEASNEEQEKFFDKLRALGLKIETVTDVLALGKEDVMKRRLASVLVERKLANTPRQARQMIVHKKVMINGRVLNVPGHLVTVDEEQTITVRKRAPKPVVKETPEANAEPPTETLEETTETKEEAQ